MVANGGATIQTNGGYDYQTILRDHDGERDGQDDELKQEDSFIEVVSEISDFSKQSRNSNQEVNTIIKRKNTIKQETNNLTLMNLNKKPDLAMLDLQKAVQFQIG